jgi:hypothetical protein
MSSYTFNSSGFSADASRDPLPAGVYVARILEASFTPLKSGNGHGVNITYEVIEGQHSKRRVWSSLNVIHSNPEAQRIAQSDLKKLCNACGGLTVTDATTHVLIGKVLRIKLKIRVDSQYGDKNAVIGYEAAPGNVVPASVAMPVTALQRAVPWASA